MFEDKHGYDCILHCANYKSRGVARSFLGAETYAFADSYDFAYFGKTDLEGILQRGISLAMFTDSEVNHAYSSHEISNVCFIRGPNNPAEGLKKRKMHSTKSSELVWLTL